MRLIDWIKGIGLLLFTPFAVLFAMVAVMFFAWPIFCIAFLAMFAVSILSEAAAWVLFGLVMGFLLLFVILKSTK